MARMSSFAKKDHDVGNFLQEKERHGGAIACGEVIRAIHEVTTGGNLDLTRTSVNEDARNEGHITNIDVGRVARRDGRGSSRAGGRCRRRRSRRGRRGRGRRRPRGGVIVLSVDEDGDEKGSSQRDDGELHCESFCGVENGKQNTRGD